jgi:hypothetical protein
MSTLLLWAIGGLLLLILLLGILVALWEGLTKADREKFLKGEFERDVRRAQRRRAVNREVARREKEGRP